MLRLGKTSSSQPSRRCPTQRCLSGAEWRATPFLGASWRAPQFRWHPRGAHSGSASILQGNYDASSRESAGLLPSDLLRSTLNDLFAEPPQTQTVTIGEPAPESHLEDISVEQNYAAASVGRAVYEVLRLDMAGKTRRIYVKRRDLLRAHGLQPRDLRRIDPSLSLTKTSPNIAVKDSVVLLNLGGVRAILAAEKCMLFEPDTASSRKFLQIVTPRLASSESERLLRLHGRNAERSAAEIAYPADGAKPPPFELEMLEGALIVATGLLDAEMDAVTKRMTGVLHKLPQNITPVNLEELRRVKQQLVELESKADNLRDMLEEIMDDEDEVLGLNLSTRPKREERRRLRERGRLINRPGSGGSSSGDSLMGYVGSVDGTPAGASQGSLHNRGFGDNGSAAEAPASTSGREAQTASSHNNRGPGQRRDSSWGGYEEGGGGEAEAALEEMEDAEAEEREAEEAEDLLEYYLQRAAGTQSEAERLLDGARDLEESIGVSLSARRFEVNRLELTLSIGSFAAALGAMVAGIFGMNLRSTLEESIMGFWGTTAAIVAGCLWVVFALFRYTRRRRIL